MSLQQLMMPVSATAVQRTDIISSADEQILSEEPAALGDRRTDAGQGGAACGEFRSIADPHLHPVVDRVGEYAELVDAGRPEGARLSRNEPLFGALGTAGRRLGDPHLSRDPLIVRSQPGGGVEVSGARARST